MVEQKIESSVESADREGRAFGGVRQGRHGHAYPRHAHPLHRRQAVGSAPIRTQPGIFSLVGEGLCVGRDGGEPVTKDYAGDRPWAFVGGVIKQVVVDVSGEPFMDLEHEATMAFMRD